MFTYSYFVQSSEGKRISIGEVQSVRLISSQLTITRKATQSFSGWKNRTLWLPVPSRFEIEETNWGHLPRISNLYVYELHHRMSIGPGCSVTFPPEGGEFFILEETFYVRELEPEVSQ